MSEVTRIFKALVSGEAVTVEMLNPNLSVPRRVHLISWQVPDDFWNALFALEDNLRVEAVIRVLPDDDGAARHEVEKVKEAEKLAKKEAKETAKKEASPYGKFWNEFDRALQAGLINNPGFNSLVRYRAAACFPLIPVSDQADTELARKVLRAELDCESRKMVSPDALRRYLDLMEFDDRNFLLEIERIEKRAAEKV